MLKVKQDLTFNVEFSRGKEKGERREMGGERWEEREREELLRTLEVNVIFHFLAICTAKHLYSDDKTASSDPKGTLNKISIIFNYL